MNLKKWFVFLLAIVLMVPVFGMTVMAAETQEFRYELTVDGKDTVEVSNGEIITVTLHLYRTDADSPYTMHAMQDEIRYDSTFFELVEDSPQLSNGVQSTDIAVAENRREFYMNFLSFGGGEKWQAKSRIGTFQLRVIGTSGVTTLTNEDYLVSLPDGSGSYKCGANVLTVILSTDCAVKFETNGGTPIDPITAIYGETIDRPEDPIREGKHLVGWFKDIHLTDEWNFETDTVKGNMTLYAKWADGDPVVPGTDTDNCMICDAERLTILGICWLCWLIIVLVMLLILFLIFRRKKKQKKYGKFQLRDVRK